MVTPEENAPVPGPPAATRTSNREPPHMNASNKVDDENSQETHAFDPPPIHEEEVLHPAPDDDEEECAEKGEPAVAAEDKEKSEVITKEAMFRLNSGQL
jgi:hypothetical protein